MPRAPRGHSPAGCRAQALPLQLRGAASAAPSPSQRLAARLLGTEELSVHPVPGCDTGARGCGQQGRECVRSRAVAAAVAQALVQPAFALPRLCGLFFSFLAAWVTPVTSPQGGSEVLAGVAVPLCLTPQLADLQARLPWGGGLNGARWGLFLQPELRPNQSSGISVKSDLQLKQDIVVSVKTCHRTRVSFTFAHPASAKSPRAPAASAPPGLGWVSALLASLCAAFPPCSPPCPPTWLQHVTPLPGYYWSELEANQNDVSHDHTQPAPGLEVLWCTGWAPCGSPSPGDLPGQRW